MSRVVSELLVSKEEQDRLQRMDRMRKDGEAFIKVINMGPPGFNRIHSIDDIEMVPYIDSDSGKTKYEKKRTSRCVLFETDRTTGERVAWVLDTEFNRHWLARNRYLEDVEIVPSIDVKTGERMLHPDTGEKMMKVKVMGHSDLLVVDDKKIAKEIEALINKPFKVELSKKERLQIQIREAERELTHIRHEEEKVRKSEKSMEAPPSVMREKKPRVKESAQQVELTDEAEGV